MSHRQQSENTDGITGVSGLLSFCLCLAFCLATYAYLPTYLCMYQVSIYLSFLLSMFLAIQLSSNPTVYFSNCLSILLPSLSSYPAVCLSIYLSSYLSIYLPIYQRFSKSIPSKVILNLFFLHFDLQMCFAQPFALF